MNDIDLDESGTLIRLFARAREWTRLIETGAFGDVKELAEGLKMDRPYVVRVLRLANLSPKILRAIIAKELPEVATHPCVAPIVSTINWMGVDENYA